MGGRIDEMKQLQEDAARYLALRQWMCAGQKSSDRMSYEMLGLVEGRTRWPIADKEFDAAIDEARKA